MKTLEIFEAFAEDRRWPRAEGRETPLTKEMIKWLNFHTYSTVHDFIPYDHKYFWLDEQDGRMCAYQTTNMYFKRITPSNIPKFKIKEAGWIGFDKSCDFSDFSWLPEKVKTLVFVSSSVKSFKGIHKYVKEVKEFYVGVNTQNGLLDIARIQNLQHVVVASKNFGENRDLYNAASILRSGIRNNDDIIDIQNAFIDAGLERFL